MIDNIAERNQKYKTDCSTCHFAQWSEDGMTQIGCDINRLTKFEEKGLTKLIEDEKANVQYYEIMTICNTCRSNKWAEGYPNPIEIVKKQVQVKVDAVIFSYDQEDPFHNIVKVVKACCAQNIKPNSIIVAIKNSELDYSELHNILTDITNQHEIPYKLVRTIDPDETYYRCLDQAIQKCISTYYMICIPGEEEPRPDFIEKLNTAINEDMIRVSMLLPEDGVNGLVVQTLLHKWLGGNRNLPIEEKIKEAAEDQETPEMIRKVGEL